MVSQEANENTPLIPQTEHVNTRSTRARAGSVVSYTYVNSQCANVSNKDNNAQQSTKRKLVFATVLALLFFTAELIAGYFANSLGNDIVVRQGDIYNSSMFCIALMSDAFHLLSDVASFIVALAAIYLAEKPATKSKELRDDIADFMLNSCINFIITQDTHLAFIVPK